MCVVCGVCLEKREEKRERGFCMFVVVFLCVCFLLLLLFFFFWLFLFGCASCDCRRNTRTNILACFAWWRERERERKEGGEKKRGETTQATDWPVAVQDAYPMRTFGSREKKSEEEVQPTTCASKQASKPASNGGVSTSTSKARKQEKESSW